MDNAMFQQILATYERERFQNHYILEERKAQVYREIPEYRELEASIASYSVNQVRRLLSDSDTDTDTGVAATASADTSYEAEIQKKRNRLNQLLKEHSLPQDYLEPIYTCPRCRDTGFVDGREKCQCLKQKIAQSLYAGSGLQELVTTENFEHLSREYYSGEDLVNFEKNYQHALNFVNHFSSDYRNLYFYGTVGTGKSFLSCCIAKELMDRGYQVIYYSANQLFDKFASYRFRQDMIRDWEDTIFHCDLLILDDLATETPGDYVKSKLFSLLNDRYVAQLPTIISSNVTLNELDEHYSERIFSRIISHYDLLKFTGPDIRIYKKRVANRK